MLNLEKITTNANKLLKTFDKADSQVLDNAQALFEAGFTHDMAVKPADSVNKEATNAMTKAVHLHRIGIQASKFPKLFKGHTPEEVKVSLCQIFNTISDPAKRNKAIAKVYPAGIDKVKEVRSYTSYFTRIRNALMIVQGVERKTKKGANKPASEYLLNLLTKAKTRATKESDNNADYSKVIKTLQDIIKQIKDMS
tara:strand:- start:51 stop:638 length:588 start_codon:yes stop_codon:yes gene_type:complete